MLWFQSSYLEWLYDGIWLFDEISFISVCFLFIFFNYLENEDKITLGQKVDIHTLLYNPNNNNMEIDTFITILPYNNTNTHCGS